MPTEAEKELIDKREAAAGEETARLAGLTYKAATSPKVYHYPSDLYADVKYGAAYPHSVIFYINARSNSRAGTAALSSNVRNDDFQAAQDRLTSEYTGQNRMKSEQYAEIAAGAGAIAAGVAGGSAVKKLFNGDVKSAIGSFIEKGAIGTAAAGVIATVADSTTQVRLLSAIELVTQTPPVATYGASYDQEDVGAVGIFGQEGGFMEALTNPGASAEYLARGAISAAAQIPASLGVNVNVGAAIEATSKKVSNPYREQLFKNMEFRKHQFSYQFAPKNRAELDDVMDIIQLFKYHMHPERTADRLFLIYPSEFQIEYRYNSKGVFDTAAEAPPDEAGFIQTSRNTWLSKIGSCVLENMRVTYGNQDFVTIQGEGGAPAFINMEITFAETELLTNDRIGQNFRNSF